MQCLHIQPQELFIIRSLALEKRISLKRLRKLQKKKVVMKFNNLNLRFFSITIVFVQNHCFLYWHQFVNKDNTIQVF